MQATKGLWLGMVGAGGVLLGGSLHGQTPPVKVRVDVENVARLTDKEKQRESEKSINEMKGVFSRANRLFQASRKEKDFVRLNCVSERLTYIKGFLRTAEESLKNLQVAIASNNAKEASHEFAKISTAQGKVKQLGAEAEGCVGEVAVYTGPVTLEVETDPTMSKQDILYPAPRISELWTTSSPYDRPPLASPPQ